MTNTLGNFSFFAYLSTNLSNFTGNSTGSTIPFDTVIYGGGGGYNPVTGVLTVPFAGRFFIASSILFTTIINGANGNLSSFVFPAKSFRMMECAMTAAKTNGNSFLLNSAMEYTLNAGENISIYAQLNNGSSASVGIQGGNSPYATWLYVRYLP